MVIYKVTVCTADTTISRRKCTNPSDLVSQATKSPVSTVVGDHTGILGVVFFNIILFNITLAIVHTFIQSNDRALRENAVVD